MAKKSKYYDDSFEDEPIPPDDDFDALGLTDDDVRAECGKQNAMVGQALYQRGLVLQRSFDGRAIHATIQDGSNNIPVVFDLEDGSAGCTHQKHLRFGEDDDYCEHIAAMMWAFAREPDSFMPQNIGGFIDLLKNNPQAREQLTRDPQFNQVIEQIEKMPVTARAALNDLPMNATPEQMAQVAALNTPDEQLQSMLRGLTLEQMRAIAKRRNWKLSNATKEVLVVELALLLASAPLPNDLLSEEEQLVRIENTLFGFQDTPSHSALLKLWQMRAGGDMKRFDNALRGLQTAGILFPCTEGQSALHYHWSPCLHSENAPYLAPKAKPYPAEKINQLKPADPIMPLTTIVDAVLELAEHEAFRVRQTKIDPRWANESFAQGWDLDPQEMEQYAKQRFFPGNAVMITFPPFWQVETQHQLESISRENGAWIAGFLFGGGMLKQDKEYARIDPAWAKNWRTETEEGRWKFLWLGWRAGAGGLTELRVAAERASFVAERAVYARDFKPINLLTDSMHARNFVARLLAPLDPLVWYSFKSFAEYVRGLHPDFLHTVTDQNTWHLAAAKTRHRFDPNNTQHWDSSYRAVLAANLDTTLRWLGVTEVVYEGKELVAFRLTALGASLLSGGKISATSEPSDPNAPSFAWVDDTTLRLRATPDAAKAMSFIRSFADPARELLTFHVTNASIARALERGVTVNELVAKMIELGVPLPNALRTKMDALAANYGRAHLYEGLAVIELADDFALRELLASTTLSQFIVHQFSPRLIVVRDENVDNWVNEITKKGYMPKVVR